ncbi:MAG: GAF domain-containing sensor histidine kinase [Luteolibacter sp.]
MIATDDPIETKRMEALRRYRILDTPPEAAFDNITALAAKLLGTPVALTTFVDTNRVWCKSTHGTEMSQMQRDAGLCPSAILEAGAYVVEDAASDPRTRSHPLVTGEFGLRFYAAIPFTTPDGHRLGTLCVMDEAPRKISEADLEILNNLALLVMDQIELRLAKQELAEKNAALSRISLDKDQLLISAIHDLRTPLSTATMLGILLAEQQMGDLTPNQVKMVSSLCEACKEMAAQLTDYSDFVAHAPSRIHLEKFPTDITSLVEGCICEHQLRAADTGIHLRLNVQAVLPEMNLDALRIRRALGTLVQNAILRSQAEDIIVVEMRMQPPYLLIEVNDQGPAITGDKNDLLFDPCSEKRARKIPGAKSTGLALPVARRLIEAHGGRMGAAGRSGRGGTFYIRLPLEGGDN